MTSVGDPRVPTAGGSDDVIGGVASARSWSRRYAPRTAPAGFFDRSWAGNTGTFAALGHRFSVRGDDGHLIDLLAAILGDLTSDEPPATVYTVVDRGQPRDRFALYVDDERISLSSRRDRVVGILLWDVNRQATVRADGRLTLVHAAAATHCGLAVVLPAPMESGKTTLVTGLVQAGFSYLSDEVAAFDPATHEVRPFPKALSLDPGSWPMFPDLEPSELVTSNQWQVPVSSIPAAVLGAGAPLGLVVAPRYVQGAETRLEPVSRGRMLTVLISSTFHVDKRAQQHLDTLADALTDAACFELQVGRLDEAVRAVQGAVAEVVGSGA